MFENPTTVFIVGALIGAALLIIGAWAGHLWANNYSPTRVRNKPEVDGSELLELLEQLADWTSDYSGTVSKYSKEIDAASASMRGAGKTSDVVSPVIQVLDGIMNSNRSLQRRLDDAERQLDKQTKDIEAYLIEAHTDALTTLPNRRAFDQRLDDMFASWRKGGSSGFVFAMLDIDHFKSINDRYGHPEGDLVLRHIGKMLKEQLDNVYLVSRFGGEEFAILMPMPLRVAAERLDRFRKLVAANPIPIDDRVNLDVTVSIGVSETREDKLIGPIVRRADEALYAAKGLGRNRVYYHDGRQPVLVGAPEVAV